VRNAAPTIYRGDLRLVSEYGSSNGYVDGSEPQFYDIRNQPIEQGRWLDWTDVAVVVYDPPARIMPVRCRGLHLGCSNCC
jgi:hypothetical protein